APTYRPEEIRMRLRVNSQEFTIGGHDVRCEEIVDRQSVLAHEVTDPAAECDHADADRTGVPEAGGEAVSIGCRRIRGRGQTRLIPCGIRLRVDDECSHSRAIEGEPAVWQPI